MVSGTVYGVQGGDDARVADVPHADASWEVSRWETILGSHVPQWGATYLKYVLPGCWGTVELPREGCPGRAATRTAM